MRRHLPCVPLLALALLLASRPGPAWAQSPSPSGGSRPSAAAGKTGSEELARYVPRAGVQFYLEFQGLEAHGDAWSKTAARGILAETKTGAMLRAVIQQVAEQALAAAPGRKLTGEDTAALVEHLFQKGFVFAVLEPAAGGAAVGVVVIRDAFAAEARPILGRFLATTGMASPGVKPVTKPGNRRVVLRPGSERDGWWIEADRDLVVAADVDRVIAALDGKADATIASDPRRLALLKPETGLEPVGIAFASIPAGSIPPSAAGAGIDALKGITYRWSLEGQALRSDLTLELPRPRHGALELLDGPALELSKLPPAPATVESVSFLSVDLADLYGQLRTLAAANTPPGRPSPFDDLERITRRQLKKDFPKDILGKLGPQLVIYTLPDKKSGFGAALAAMNPLAGLQVPRLAILLDAQDPKDLSRTVRDLTGLANKQLATLMPAGLPGDPGAGPGTPPGNRAGGAASKKAQAPEFKMTSSQPVTYQLNLPPQLAALTNLKLTLAVGKSHLIVASSPDLVREALALEEKAGARWKPTGEFAQAIEGLPEKLAFLQVSDPRGSQPEFLAKLPELIQQGISAAAAQAGQLGAAAAGAPGAGGPGGPGGPGGGSPGAGAGGPGGGRQLQGVSPAGGGGGPGGGRQLQGVSPAGGGGGAGAPPTGGPGGPGGPPPGGPGGPPIDPAAIGQALSQFRLNLPPEAQPDAAAIRERLFPGAAALVADDAGIRWITREAFPNVSVGGTGVGTALLLPAVQSARDAARRAAGLPPGPPIGPAGPGGLPGAPPGGPGGGAPGTIAPD